MKVTRASNAVQDVREKKGIAMVSVSVGHGESVAVPPEGAQV